MRRDVVEKIIRLVKESDEKGHERAFGKVGLKKPKHRQQGKTKRGKP